MGLRRGRRRKIRTSAPSPATDLNGVDGLRAWALSQPWVREEGGSLAFPDLRKYVIECPLLDVRRVWLTIIGTGSPGELFAFFTLREGHISCVTFAALSSETQQLERALRQAYDNAFAGCSQ